MCQEIEVDDLPCLSLRNSQTVLRHFFLKVDRAFIPGDFYGIKPADGQAFPAANTYLGVYDGKLFTHLNSAHRTPPTTYTTGITPFLLDLRNYTGVLRQFPTTRGEPHPNILQGSAHSCCQMPCHMGNRDDGIRRPGNAGHKGVFTQFLVNLHPYIMLSKKPVSNDNGGANIFITKTVIVGVREVINGIGTATFIQRVCLYQKRFPVTFFYFIYNCLYDGRLEVTGIPLFTKTRFHRHHVFFTDRVLKTGKIK